MEGRCLSRMPISAGSRYHDELISTAVRADVLRRNLPSRERRCALLWRDGRASLQRPFFFVASAVHILAHMSTASRLGVTSCVRTHAHEPRSIGLRRRARAFWQPMKVSGLSGRDSRTLISTTRIRIDVGNVPVPHFSRRHRTPGRKNHAMI